MFYCSMLPGLWCRGRLSLLSRIAFSFGSHPSCFLFCVRYNQKIELFLCLYFVCFFACFLGSCLCLYLYHPFWHKLQRYFKIYIWGQLNCFIRESPVQLNCFYVFVSSLGDDLIFHLHI